MQAQLLLESAQAMKSKAARDGAFATLAACALRYGQLEAVAGASVAALTRNEHLAGVLAELADFCEAKYHDERLVCLTVVCKLLQQDGFAAAIVVYTCLHPCRGELLRSRIWQSYISMPVYCQPQIPQSC